MYNGIKVLDIHGHYSSPAVNGGAAVALMMASNTPLKDDPRKDLPRFGMSEQAWANALKRHLEMMDDHNIDAQLIGPRPFLTAQVGHFGLAEPGADDRPALCPVVGGQ